jgi:ankyrin repeat protein
LNKADIHGVSPLFVAATLNKAEIVELLVATLWDTAVVEKVDLNQRDEEGRTPILMATRGNHIEIIKMLIEAGADLEENLLSNAATEETKQIIATELKKQQSNLNKNFR